MGKPHCPPRPLGITEAVQDSRASYAELFVMTAVVAVILLGASWAVWFAVHQTIEVHRQEQIATDASLFAPGDMVVSRAARFRGVVLSRSCYKSCWYSVRFNGASMQPIEMAEAELEAWKP